MDLVRKRLTMQAETFRHLCELAAKQNVSLSLLVEEILATHLAKEVDDGSEETTA